MSNTWSVNLAPEASSDARAPDAMRSSARPDGDDGLAHGAVETPVLDYLDVGAMARFFDAKKHGDLQKQATTEFELVFPNQGPNIRKRGTTF